MAELKLTPNKSSNTLTAEFMKKLIAGGSLKEVKYGPDKGSVKLMTSSQQQSELQGITQEDKIEDESDENDDTEVAATDEKVGDEDDVPDMDPEFMFPIDSDDQVEAIERWLTVEKNRDIMLNVLHSFNEGTNELMTVFNKVFTNRFTLGYSWEGKGQLKRLSNLTMAKLMVEAWQLENESSFGCEKRIRVCIFHLHSRDRLAKLKLFKYDSLVC